MIKKLIPGSKYEFLWNDTYSENGWMDEDQISAKTIPMLHESIGYLIKETKTWYIIAMHKNNTPGFLPWALVSWIPKGSIKKISSL